MSREGDDHPMFMLGPVSVEDDTLTVIGRVTKSHTETLSDGREVTVIDEYELEGKSYLIDEKPIP